MEINILAGVCWMKMKTEEDSEPGRKRRGFLEQEHGEPAGLKITEEIGVGVILFPFCLPTIVKEKPMT